MELNDEEKRLHHSPYTATTATPSSSLHPPPQSFISPLSPSPTLATTPFSRRVIGPASSLLLPRPNDVVANDPPELRQTSLASHFSNMVLRRIRVVVFCLMAAVVITTITASTEVLQARQQSTLNVKDGKATYAGVCSSSVCSWKGVRYARPPTGQYRFAPAQKAATAFGNIDASTFGPTCLQDGSGNQNEDCLFVNIYRPANVPLTKKLPVLLFVHGGGFQSGAGSNLDPSPMVSAGAGAGLPAVVMTINYRLGVFGFSASSTFLKRQKANSNDVTLNAAFTDVRRALSWTKAHVSAFGGDPSEVTLWGQSAGSFLSAGQMLGSHSSPNFKAVILESGSPGGVPVDPASAKDGQYNTVLQATNCASASDTVACLRGVDANTLRTVSIQQNNLNQNAATTPRGYYSWTMVQDGGPSNGGFYSDRPSVVIKAGKFAKVPLLHGDCYDEGTVFAYQGSNDDQSTINYFKQIYLNGASDDLVNNIFRLYPDDPVQGSPFIPHSGNYNNRYYGLTNQYKRIAALYGDIRYQSNRRFFLGEVANQGVRAYSYEFAQYVSGNADAVGYPHGSDLNFVMNAQSNNPFGATLALQWLSFATYQTPNKAGVQGAPHWPQYTKKAKKVYYYANQTLSVVDDSFRSAQFDLLNSNAVLKVTGR